MVVKATESSLFADACKELGAHSTNTRIMTFVDAKSRGRYKFCVECGEPLPYRGFYIKRNKYIPVGLTLECKKCINELSLNKREALKSNDKRLGQSVTIRWSLDDDKFICDNYFYANDKELARRLGRAESEVKLHRINDLKLTRNMSLRESIKRRHKVMSQLKRLDWYLNNKSSKR